MVGMESDKHAAAEKYKAKRQQIDEYSKTRSFGDSKVAECAGS